MATGDRGSATAADWLFYFCFVFSSLFQSSSVFFRLLLIYDGTIRERMVLEESLSMVWTVQFPPDGLVAT